MKRVINRYNENPEGWNVLLDGRGHMLIVGPNINYKIRFMNINPYEYTGVGTKIETTEEIRNALKNFPHYGFRPLSKANINRMLKSIHRKGAITKKLIKELTSIKPIPIHDLEERGGGILTGPIITHPDLSTISSAQRKLEAKLAIEAEKLFLRKYPSRARLYQ